MSKFLLLVLFHIIALEHACPFGLYYASTYSSKCKGIICYPFRYYSKGSYDRRIWKLKTNNGYAKIIKKYDVDNYMINITPFSLKNGTLFSKKNIIAPFQA